MIKRILIFLLMSTLLFSLAVIVSAEILPDGEIPAPTISADPESDQSDTITQVVVVQGASDLPEGYVIDEDFFIKLTLKAEDGWSYNIEELLKGLESEDYIYFVVEEDIPEGYDAIYSMSNVVMASGVTFGDDIVITGDIVLTDGNVIVIKNVKDGEPPIYELPETGGVGTKHYTIAGVTVLLFAAVYYLVLRHKRKADAS